MTETRPDIVIVMTDEERATPPYEGHAVTDWRTRTLRGAAWFEEHGVNFTRHYTGSLACVPSRPTIFTGQDHVREHQVDRAEMGFAGARETPLARPGRRRPSRSPDIETQGEVGRRVAGARKVAAVGRPLNVVGLLRVDRDDREHDDTQYPAHPYE